MRFEVEFSDGAKVIHRNLAERKGLPYALELQGVDGVSRPALRLTTSVYVKALEFLFQGVSNYASGKIVGMRIEDTLGTLSKRFDGATWGAQYPKERTVVFTADNKSVGEKMYMADSVYVEKNKAGKAVAKPVWVTDLIAPSSDLLRRNLIAAIGYAHMHGKGYKMVYQDGQFAVSDPNGKMIKISQIDDDEVYVLFQLMERIAYKGEHVGVYLINAAEMSASFVKTLVEMIYKSMISLGDTYVFLYNLPDGIDLEYEKIPLPYFKV